MARLRQQHPQNYVSSGNIHADIENLVRYINAAELGDKTVGELFTQLFNEKGEFDGPIEMRLNTEAGLEYRVGEYTDVETGWQVLADISDIRGPAGQNLGTIEGPLFFNRQDTVIASDGVTEISYSFSTDTEDILLLKNGVLLRGTGLSPDYTYDESTDTITLASAVNTGDDVAVISIRAGAVTNYRRLDYIASGTVAVVPFVHTDQERILVYKNGILQREGAVYDYVQSAATDTITFLTPLNNADVASILTVENQAQTNVAGLMLEDEYAVNGLIDFAKISVSDDQIPQAKVSQLASTLGEKAKISVASTTPSTPTSGDLWLDTSVVPNILKFYQGTQWLSASPDNALPTFATSNAGQYVRVNGTGTLLEYGDIDFSALVPKTFMGAANGVASLDSDANIPTSQLPEIYSVNTMDRFVDGTIANETYRVRSIYKQRVRIDGVSAVLSSGTCTIQLAVDGTAIGTTYAVSATRINQDISPVIEIDGTTAGRRIEVIVTSNSSGNDLDVAISFATLST